MGLICSSNRQSIKFSVYLFLFIFSILAGASYQSSFLPAVSLTRIKNFFIITIFIKQSLEYSDLN